ncbi:uncharacterized protein LOC132560944 [Ylistrum balloti]|uniref:uncharacterized protein LOC132560944 n=1 Tax=Ylistrum balloti TaxID=509963 RepID=UPI002905D42A|nr:uncharacterized protein LOC132560944 [Ylistrum balloti]XP_060081632.1 uncharacterized protein LOC132560944 [Ylistrum balloti]
MASQLLMVVLRIKESGTPGLDLPTFLSKVDGFLKGYPKASRVIHKFKVCGEPKVVAILEVNNILGLERNMGGLSRLGIFDVSCIPLSHYETFAAALNVDPTLTKVSQQPLKKKFIFWLSFNVEYQGITTAELLELWRKEATAALSARAAGTQLDAYKVIAERKVHVFIGTDVPEDVDKLSFNLPLMQENGANTHIECRAVQHLADYTTRIMTEKLQ